MSDQQGNAPAATDAPSDSELDSLKLEQAKAEARKAIAEARKAEQSALLPDLKVDIPENKLDAGETASAMAEILAYAELPDAAEHVVEQINDDIMGDVLNTHVLLVESAELEQAHGVYIALTSFLTTLAQTVEAAMGELEEPKAVAEKDAPQQRPFAIPAAIGLGLSVLPTILSLFKHDRTIRQREVKISANAVHAAVARALRDKGAKVIVDGFTTVPHEQGVFKSVEDLQQKRNELADRQLWWKVNVTEPRSGELEIEKARLGDLYEQRNAMLKEGNAADPLKAEIEEVRKGVAGLETQIAEANFKAGLAQRVLDAVDTFVATITTVPQDGVAPIVLAAVLQRFFDQGSCYVLFVEASFAAGESRYDAKFGADKAMHIGSLAMSYLLTDESGLILSSSVSCRAGIANQKIGDSTLTRHTTVIV